ncbi:MAG TPA: DUF2071 domain-containing protein [Gemmatimonadales bacterium]|nr:DUF2071 domain-containing protein [Gemmatimonadales bacterium]
MNPRPFLTAAWRHLVMLNYDIEPSVLTRLIPRGTELDLWKGRTLVSLVGFRFLDTRVLGVSIPFHRNFDEINLRFYVRRRVEAGWRRGVVFIREVVPRKIIAAVARIGYNEPYIALPMRNQVDMVTAESGGDGLARYRWRQHRWYTIEARTSGPPQPLEPDSEAEFITEHYWGYTRQRDGGTMEYRVDHPRWQVWNAHSSQLDCDVEKMYGPDFGPALSGVPASAFVADGSPVTVYQGHRLPD